MKKATFNDLIEFEYPEDFLELTKEENEKYFSGDLSRVSFQNRDKHILLSLSKSKDSFMNYIIGVASVVSGSLSAMERNLKDFAIIEECESTIFEKQAITECFLYTASNENVKQYGELSVFKAGKAFYVVYCISRFDDREENKQLFKQFRDSFVPMNS